MDATESGIEAQDVPERFDPAADSLLRNRASWQELETLVKKARKKGPARMTADELSRLDVLYRRTTTLLARAATRTEDPALVAYLNDLAAAAHGVIYAPPQRKPIAGILFFLATGFPRAVARTWIFHLVSAVIFIGGGLFGYYASNADPMAAYAILPAQETRLPGTPREELIESLRSGRDLSSEHKVFFASFLFRHNFTIGILSFAVGILAAVPTLLLIIYNGMMIGAFSYVHLSQGIHAEYWAWILPHGVPELTAIMLCGGAGLALGAAVINPGGESRITKLTAAGKEAAKILLGVGMLLFFAAIIESFLRQSHMETWERLAFAGSVAVAMAGYFAMGFVYEWREKKARRMQGVLMPAAATAVPTL
ncbi:stage II sporulation protein M [Oceanidesulfovibrio marinus]|uniref:stage II sporulation protein M n=1 Tax=Oceanidesulfovibrio marinus TaxID=370038 RepID=UPI00148AFBBE|nr:stage II sporulation protein M [Oceanidesulfovibrio marinus]